MTEKVLRVLEYNKIVALLEEKATSLPGKIKCSKLLPQVDLNEINQAQLETADALALLFQKGSLSFSGNTDLSYCFRILALESSLSQVELLRIADLLECAKRAKHYLKSERTNENIGTSLSEYFEAISPLKALLEEIRRCILSEEEISDFASSTLHKIRKQMATSNDKIHTLLSKLLTGSYSSYLQDAVITMRNNRYCIPLHTAPMAKNTTSKQYTLPITNDISDRLLRLPCYYELTSQDTKKKIRTSARVNPRYPFARSVTRRLFFPLLFK